MNGQEPEITRTDPRAYYFYLQSQGLNPYQAALQVQQRFGQGSNKGPKDQQNKQTANQLAAVGGQVGGIVAGKYIYDQATAPSATETPKQDVQAPQPDVSGASQTPDSSSGVPPATEVGSITMPDGSPGTLMSDGSSVGQDGTIINADGSSGGSITGEALAGMQVAGGVAQAYNGYRQYQSGEKLGGAANVAGGAYSTAAGAQALANGGTAGSLGNYAPYVGTAVAAAQIGQQMINDEGASEDRAAKSETEAQKAALLWIPGYGWVAYAALAAIDAFTGGKGTETWMKLNKANNRWNDRFDLGLGKNIRSKVFHQSTKGRQKERTAQLMQQSDDPQWQNYVANMRLQPEDPSKKGRKPFFGGTYATFDEYKKAGLQASDLTGVYGNLDAFKPAYAEEKNLPNWAQLSLEQQTAVTQRLIDEDMYASKKGDVVIPDKEKARRIYEEMAANNFGVQRKKGSPDIRGSLQNNLRR